MNQKNKPYEDSEIYKLRHTAAHLLAMAAIEWDPEVKLAIGPPIENGFYYDFQFSRAITDKDLSTLEKTIQKLINKDIPIKSESRARQKVISDYQKQEQPYKQELAEKLEDKELSFYGIDTFWDLCKGPHVKSTGQVGAVKLLSTAGAYWRGDEHQPMLTRIYGTAFSTKKQLDEYLAMLDEAKKRDHKILGQKLNLFTFSELVGSGLPLWKPKGAILREILDETVWQLRKERGYQKVEIPHITKKDLYEKSGHWEKFKDDLFIIETREGHQFAMKPMNCPHHTQIFASDMHSYREMPVRYANTTMVYRDEQSGELAGLSRVRSITQDDAHIFCRENQINEMVNETWDIIDTFYGKFNFKLEPRLSLMDPKTPEKYLGSPEKWKTSEDALRKIAKKRNVKVIEQAGEAAFYGPKIDFMTHDSLGREWQVATIQLDFNMPESFDLYCINEKGDKERIVMIHAAIMGSLERFISVLIEHYAGEFPFWLSPTQMRLLSVSESAEAYCQKICDQLTVQGVRAEADTTNDTLGKKIRRSEIEKIPVLAIVGDKEVQSDSLSIRQKDSPDQKNVKVSQLPKFLSSLT